MLSRDAVLAEELPGGFSAIYPVLSEGAQLAYASASERDLITFLPEDEPARSQRARALAAALLRWLERCARLALPYESVDGVPLKASTLAPFLRAAGFAHYGLGFRIAAPPVLKP